LQQTIEKIIFAVINNHAKHDNVEQKIYFIILFTSNSHNGSKL